MPWCFLDHWHRPRRIDLGTTEISWFLVLDDVGAMCTGQRMLSPMRRPAERDRERGCFRVVKRTRDSGDSGDSSLILNSASFPVPTKKSLARLAMPLHRLLRTTTVEPSSLLTTQRWSPSPFFNRVAFCFSYVFELRPGWNMLKPWPYHEEFQL